MSATIWLDPPEKPGDEQKPPRPPGAQVLSPVSMTFKSDGAVLGTVPADKTPFLRLTVVPETNNGENKEGASETEGERSCVISTVAPPGFALAKDVCRTWARLVTQYCRRSLSKPSDKLVAIAALAKEFQERYGQMLGEYHVGIWAEFAAEGLLWYVSKPFDAPEQGIRPVPSWSWAAVDGASYTNPQEEEKLGVNFLGFDTEVLGIQTVAAENGLPLAAVPGGWMMIKGGLCDAWWGPKEQEGDEAHAQPARSNHDGKGLTLFDSKDSGVVLGEFGRVYADCPSGSPWAKEQVRHLLLVRRYVSGIGHDEDHWCEMLVLKHCEDVFQG